MAVVVNKTDYQQLQGSDFSSRKVEQTTVIAQFTRTAVDVPNDCFLQSNHFIKCTNVVKKGRKLCKFLYGRWMWQIHFWKLYIVYCIACFFVWVHLAVAIVIFLSSFPLFCLSVQYIVICSVCRSCDEFKEIDERAMKYMNSARKRSWAMVLLSTAQIFWALFWVIMGAASNGSVITAL